AWLVPLTALIELRLYNVESFDDLSVLSAMHQLEALDAGANSGITNLAPLAGLTRLRRLTLWGTRVRNLEGVAGLPLRQLDLGHCERLMDLSQLPPSLETLSLYQCDALSDLAPLSRTAGLRALKLGGRQLTTVAPLAELHALEELNLDNCPSLSTVAPLA